MLGVVQRPLAVPRCVARRRSLHTRVAFCANCDSRRADTPERPRRTPAPTVDFLPMDEAAADAITKDLARLLPDLYYSGQAHLLEALQSLLPASVTAEVVQVEGVPRIYAVDSTAFYDVRVQALLQESGDAIELTCVRTALDPLAADNHLEGRGSAPQRPTRPQRSDPEAGLGNPSCARQRSADFFDAGDRRRYRGRRPRRVS